MKLEDYGYNVRTGVHSKLLSVAESCFVGILWTDHVGRGNKISAPDFAVEFAFGMGILIGEDKKELEFWKRSVRHMQNHILEKHDQIPVMSKAGTSGGYWIAATDEEGAEFYATFRRRGLTGLVKGSRGKKAAMIEVVQQIAFEFEDLVDHTAGVARELKEDQGHMAPEIVDALLAKMTQSPEKFASNLRKIREKYFRGGVLLERERLAAMSAKARELQEMIQITQIGAD